MALLTDEELIETLETQLPALLARHPKMEQRIYTAFMRTFATKEEVATILSELRSFRGEFETFRLKNDEQFGKVDERVGKVEERVKKVEDDLRNFRSEFETFRLKNDERVEKVNERFEKVEDRLKKIEDDLRNFRSEFDTFRSEVNKRFEKVEDRLKKVEDDLRDFRAEFDTFRSEVNKRFDHMDQRFSDLKDWVEMIVGRFQTRSGRKLEDVVAGTMRLVLGRDDILSRNIRLRQPLEDVEGMIGPSGRRYEVDILVDNSALLVFEVKSVCELEDVDRFADKVALMRTLHPDKIVNGVIVTMAPLNEVEARCVEWDIELVH